MDIEILHVKAPQEFPIPSLSSIDQLKIGVCVELAFIGIAGKGLREGRERMWVKITSIDKKGKFKGILANTPYMLIGIISKGDLIDFDVKNIISIHKKKQVL